MVLKFFLKFKFGMIFIGVTSRYQSLGLSELEEHSCDPVSNQGKVFKMVFKWLSK